MKLSAMATVMMIGGTSKIMATMMTSWAWMSLGCTSDAIAMATEKQ